jgi:hypothetical protein
MEDRGCPPQAAFIVWPRSVTNGKDLTLSCVKHRAGRRHRVTLKLVWHELEDEWWLVRYSERPIDIATDPSTNGPGTEPM